MIKAEEARQIAAIGQVEMVQLESMIIKVASTGGYEVAIDKGSILGIMIGKYVDMFYKFLRNHGYQLDEKRQTWVVSWASKILTRSQSLTDSDL
jgi:hypothetical protein